MKQMDLTAIDLGIKSALRNERNGHIREEIVTELIGICKPIIQYLSEKTLNLITDYSVGYDDIYQEGCIALISNINKLYLTKRSNNLAVTTFSFIEAHLNEVYLNEEEQYVKVYLYDTYLDDIYEAYISNDETPVERIIEFNNLHRDLESILSNIDPNEQKILKERFGFTSGEVRCLESISKEYGLTRERVRRIEAEGLKKLRNPHICQLIRIYLED